ncbi:MAG: hypothetical protein IJG13_18635 [Kiritimatiellae bacterium]|nr:hypothetical protein [Kiritimatiellia bacterium]
MRRVVNLIRALALGVVLFAGCGRDRHENALPPNASSNCLELAEYVQSLPSLVTNGCMSSVGEFSREIIQKHKMLANEKERAYIANELDGIAWRFSLADLDFQKWQKAHTWIMEFFQVARYLHCHHGEDVEVALECWFRELDFFDAERERCEAESRRCEEEARRCYETARKFELTGDFESGRKARAAGGKYGRAHCNFMHQASLCRGTLSATCNLVVDSESSILAKFCKENPGRASKMIARVSKRLGRKPKWCM